MGVYVVKSQHNIDKLHRGIISEIQGQNIKTNLRGDQIELRGDCLDTIKQVLSNAVSEFIVGHLEQKQIEKIVSQNYEFLNLQERQELIQSLQTEKDDLEQQLFHIRKKKIIENAVKDYLNRKKYLYIEGFLPFRLQGYIAELENYVDNKADEMLTHREYMQFLGLLRYFVNIQQSKIDLLNIIALENGGYVLLDQAGRMVADEETTEIGQQMQEIEASLDDALLSSLINLAPKKLTVHNHKNQKPVFKDTLRQIFDSRISFCEGCIWCNLGIGEDGGIVH